MLGSFQTRSVNPRALWARDSVVPPTEVTVARLAGKLAASKPKSPDEATTMWPGCR